VPVQAAYQYWCPVRAVPLGRVEKAMRGSKSVEADIWMSQIQQRTP
jgi:hypothetical protein